MERLHRVFDPFATLSYRKALGPALVSAAGLAIGDMADAIVLGQRMGATGLAAVSLALPVFMMINVVMHGFGAGGAILFSQYLGEGKPRKASDSFSQVFFTVLCLGIALAAGGTLFLPQLMRALGVSPADGELYEAARTYVQWIVWGIPVFFASYVLNYYLRNDDNQVLASRGFTAGNLADLGLNVLLVLVLDLGVVGAALSTLLGQCIALAVYLTGLWGKSHMLRLHRVPISLREPARCFGVGLSTSVQYLYQFFFFLIVNRALMDGAGENGVAVFNVLQNISYLVLYLYDGAAKAAQPLVSTYSGERNHASCRATLFLSLMVGNGLGIALCAGLAAGASGVCRLFGLTGAGLLAGGMAALRIYCISLVFAGSSTLLESYFQACGQERRALILATLRGAVILLPCTALFALLPVEWFWWLFPTVEVLSLAVFAAAAPVLAPAKRDDSAVFTKTIPCTSRDIGWLTESVQAFCAAHGATPSQEFFTGMAVEEICLAALENLFDSSGKGIVQVTVVAAADGLFELHIRDNGQRRNPFFETQTHALDPSAMGIEVVRKKAKSFFYRHYQGFNTLTIQI